MNKRTFIRQSVILAAGAPLLNLACTLELEKNGEKGKDGQQPSSGDQQELLPYLDKIGLQVYTVRDQMSENARLTLQTLAEIGYQQVELYDFGNLETHRAICEDVGLAVNSIHVGSVAVTGRWELTPDDAPVAFEELLNRAKLAGISHLVVPYLHQAEREDLDSYKLFCDQFNQAGELAKQADISLSYHNHNFEFDPMEGSNGFAVMQERFDPDLVSFELDVFWAKIASQEPIDIMQHLGNRLKLLHLKDLRSGIRTMTSLDQVPDQAFEEIGDGVIDMKAIMRLGAQLGVAHCFVEQDRSPDPMQSVTKSFDFLNA